LREKESEGEREGANLCVYVCVFLVCVRRREGACPRDMILEHLCQKRSASKVIVKYE